ncbi:MAG: thioredoxin-disulfide reductase [Oscillospiraceae bacterium]|nr:thioredoxin-disulfide reductase [Oscillospiraceae bacterium]
MAKIYDIAIIGGGPAGYSAALYGARAGLATVVLEKLAAGGQMGLTHQIDNYPGFDQGIDGFTLGQQMRAGAERFGAETRLTEVTKLALTENPKRIETTEGTLLARAVILATGANPRHLDIPMEQELTGKGVSYCAFCDGMFYRNKTVVVVGGGNTAAAEALQLSRIAKEVILVHRRDTLRATKIYHEPLQAAENVRFLWNSAVTRLHSEARLTGVTVQNLVTGEETLIPTDGLFVSIGRIPATDLVRDQLALDPGGYIPADETTVTAIPGVFAAGDLRTKPLRQVATAISDGATAVQFAEEYLAGLKE